jgi:CheY-like chemotaxis protein
MPRALRRRPPRALRAGLRAAFGERAVVRLRVAAILRNFDAEPPEPPPAAEVRIPAVTIALWQAATQGAMNELSRAARVLVVEDDEDIAQALQRTLRMEGYEVRAASDGRIALEEGRAFVPDLVILDLGLPEIDGLDVARSLRADDDIPILILTARDAVDSRVEGLDAGADD